MAAPKQDAPSEQKVKAQYQHRRETHGRSDDIDENTPIDQIKGPSVFERAKEEFDALIDTIHPRKDNDVYSSNKDEGGFLISIGRWFEKLCCPGRNHKD